MKVTHTLSLPASGNQDTLKRRTLDLPKGRLMQGLVLRFAGNINKSDAGNTTLSDAQKQALFNLFRISANYGKGGQHKFIKAMLMARTQAIARRAYGSEMELYTDATDGLGKQIAASGNTAVAFYMLVPTGKDWLYEPEIRQGMGRSQAKTLELTIKREADVIAGTLSLNGTWTIDVIPDDVACKGDQWHVIPEYEEDDSTEKTVKTSPGLHKQVIERTAVHASTSLTNITVKCDDEELVDQLAPSRIIRQLNDSARMLSAGLTSDRDTLIVDFTPEQRWEDLPTGVVSIRQNVKDLATFKIGDYFQPLKSQDEWKKDLAHVATDLREKTIRAVSLADVQGREIPDRLRPYYGYVLVDSDDAEFERFGGFVAAPGSDPEPFVPKGLADRARAAVADHLSKGETKAAEAVVRRVAAQVPGAIEHPRGFSFGSGILESIRSRLFK